MLQILNKYKYVIAFIVFLIHLFFKNYHLGQTGFWYDEAYSVYWGGGRTVKEILLEGLENDPNPPLYLILLHYWIPIFGDTEYGVRLLSVVASSLTAGVLFLFTLRFFNWQTSIFASIMFLTSGELYYYSQEARAFSLVLLTVILSYYVFLSLINRPTVGKIVVLGLLNAAVFYLHILSTLSVAGQLLIFPFLLFKYHPVTAPDSETYIWKKFKLFHFIPITYKKRQEYLNQTINFSIHKKMLLFFLFSLLVFVALLYPWMHRIMDLGQNGLKNFWLTKPTYREFKDCLYDFFNSQSLFNVYVFSFLVFCILILFKKFCEQGMNKKMILFALVVGPGLLYLNYFLAGIQPIFLKRYVLFTVFGFVLLYTYIFSLVKFNFFLKLSLFLVLSFFSFKKIIYPRESVYDYDKACVFLKSVQSKNTFITNDVQDIFSYYYDKKCFYIKEYVTKHNYLLAKGILTPFNLDWPKTEDFSKYRLIYYTAAFAAVYDRENKVENALNEKFIRVKEINCFKGMRIICYYNPAFDKKK